MDGVETVLVSVCFSSERMQVSSVTYHSNGGTLSATEDAWEAAVRNLSLIHGDNWFEQPWEQTAMNT